MGRRCLFGNVDHVAVHPVQPVARLARVVVGPSQRQAAEGIEVRIAAARRVGQEPQAPGGRDVARRPSCVLHRQADESAADADLVARAGDQLIALQERFPRIGLLGGPAALAIPLEERADGRLHFRMAGPRPRQVVQFPKLAGKITGQRLPVPAAEDGVDRH